MDRLMTARRGAPVGGAGERVNRGRKPCVGLPHRRARHVNSNPSRHTDNAGEYRDAQSNARRLALGGSLSRPRADVAASAGSTLWR